jgi:hypothetical protein
MLFISRFRRTLFVCALAGLAWPLLQGVASAEIAISGNDAKVILEDGVVKVDPNRVPDNLIILA